MNSVVRLLVCFATVAGLLAGLTALQPVWLTSLGLDVGKLAELSQQIDRENQRGEELKAVQRDLSRKLVVKNQAIRELIDGRLSLAEAVARFRALSEESPSAVEKIRESYPAASLGGSVCRQVLSWAEFEVHWSSPECETEVMARLEEEARGILGPR